MKIYTIFLILILLFTNSSSKDNSFTIIKLRDLTETSFSLNNQVIVLYYENNIQRIYNSSINLVFKYGEKSSTKVYIYDSLDKINNIKDNIFIDYLKETSLKDTKCIQISHDDSFYKDNCTYYIVLYDYSLSYSDSVYVINSLKYLTFENEFFYRINCSSELTFNFLIQKNYLTYLHYQTSGTGVSLFGNTYYINITNENGEILLNKKSDETSDYVRIEPNMKYFASITINIGTYSQYYFPQKPEFLLNYEKYGYNILLEDEREVKRRILSPQHFSFFKNISNLSIDDESIVFSGNFNNYFLKSLFYIKFYQSDDFYSLVSSFPSDKKDFDYQVGNLDSSLSFKIEIKRIYNSQKGVLFGFFIESNENFYINSVNNYINIKCEKAKKDHDDTDKEERIESDDNDKENSSYDILWIIIGILAFFIFIIILCCCIIFNNNKNNIQQSNYNKYQYNNSNYNYNNKNVNYNQNNYSNNEYNNYNCNKVTTNNEVVYDYPPPPFPAINEN